MRGPAGVLLLGSLLSGCVATGYTLIEPRRTAIGNLYTVEPQIAWSSLKRGKVELWTVDGPALEAIRFVSALSDGDGLFEEKGKEKGPTFKREMTATEIMEFIVDSVAGSGAEKVEATGLRPQKFGNVEGLRFEMRFVTRRGLEGEGLVVGAVVQEKLYLVMYSGARAHYYPKYKDQVDRIIESIRMQ